MYIVLLILFVEWFYNHPALRYGGYYIIAILIFIPLSKILSSFENTKVLKLKLFVLYFCQYQYSFLEMLIVFIMNIQSIVFHQLKMCIMMWIKTTILE